MPIASPNCSMNADARHAANRRGGIEPSCEKRLDVLEPRRDPVHPDQSGKTLRELLGIRSEFRAKRGYVATPKV
jgi:hypothetical protein